MNNISPVEKAKKENQELRGDKLPNKIFERLQEGAKQKNFQKKRFIFSEKQKQEKKKEWKKIGSEIYQPIYGQDVGSGAFPSWKDPKKLAFLLQKDKLEKNWQQQLDVALLKAKWSQVVGKNIAANTEIVDFKNETLVIQTKSVAWETQLRALFGQLEKKIVQEVGEGTIKKIIIKGPHRPNWNHGKFVRKGRGVRDTYD